MRMSNSVFSHEVSEHRAFDNPANSSPCSKPKTSTNARKADRRSRCEVYATIKENARWIALAIITRSAQLRCIRSDYQQLSCSTSVNHRLTPSRSVLSVEWLPFNLRLVTSASPSTVPDFSLSTATLFTTCSSAPRTILWH